MLTRLLVATSNSQHKQNSSSIDGDVENFAHSLFKQLNPNDASFRACVTSRTLRRGQHLYRPRDTRACVYSIHRGMLKTYRPLHDCSERISGFHFPGELLGLDALFGLPVRRGAVALGHATVFMIPVVMLIEYLRRSELTRLELLGHFNAEIARLEEHLSLDKVSAEQRLAAFVLWGMDKLSPQSPQPKFTLPMSQKDIGNYLGLVPETVSRLFSRFEDRRWLSMNRRDLTVHDLAELRQAAAGRNSRAPGEMHQEVHHACEWMPSANSAMAGR